MKLKLFPLGTMLAGIFFVALPFLAPFGIGNGTYYLSLLISVGMSLVLVTVGLLDTKKSAG